MSSTLRPLRYAVALEYKYNGRTHDLWTRKQFCPQVHHWPSTAQVSNSERNGLQFRGKVGLTFGVNSDCPDRIEAKASVSTSTGQW